jgi:hypothetical protein
MQREEKVTHGPALYSLAGCSAVELEPFGAETLAGARAVIRVSATAMAQGSGSKSGTGILYFNFNLS